MRYHEYKESILLENGWQILTETPSNFSICHEDTGSIATGIAADIVYESCVRKFIEND